MSSLGEVIQKARKEKQLTTTELALKVELTQGYISHIENNRKIPSLDIIKKLSQVLEIDYYEMAQLAGHYTHEDSEFLRYYSNNIPEEGEAEAYYAKQIKSQIKYRNIQQYQEKIHVRIEDFLKDSRRHFYIDDHKLTDAEIKMLITLYGGKEKNYPSDNEIEKEYEAIKRKQEENQKRIDNGEAILTVNHEYDIETNEEI